jgi:hypothetical protein
MNQFEAGSAEINLAELAAVTRKDLALLQSIQYESETEKRSFVLLRQFGRRYWTETSR